MLDIDHFKRVNGSHGHQPGTSMLQSVARLLRSPCAPWIPWPATAAEEFAIVLPMPLALAASVAERMRAAPSRPRRSYIALAGMNVTQSRYCCIAMDTPAHQPVDATSAGGGQHKANRQRLRQSVSEEQRTAA